MADYTKCEPTMSLQVDWVRSMENANSESDLAAELILKGLAWHVLRTKMQCLLRQIDSA